MLSGKVGDGKVIHLTISIRNWHFEDIIEVTNLRSIYDVILFSLFFTTETQFYCCRVTGVSCMPDIKKRSLTEVQPRPSSLGCNASSKPQHSQKPPLYCRQYFPTKDLANPLYFSFLDRLFRISSVRTISLKRFESIKPPSLECATRFARSSAAWPAKPCGR